MAKENKTENFRRNIAEQESAFKKVSLKDYCLFRF